MPQPFRELGIVAPDRRDQYFHHSWVEHQLGSIRVALLLGLSFVLWKELVDPGLLLLLC
jgi:hypothetical protein